MARHGAKTTTPFLSGWGRVPLPGREVLSEDLLALTRDAVLSRGLGRSYGDSSLPPPFHPLFAGTRLADRLRAFDAGSGLLRAEAGLSLQAVNRLFLPRGFYGPVTPGTQSITLGGMVAVMFYINWRFTLIALSIVPVLSVVVYFFTKRIKKTSREVRQKQGELLTIVQEVFSSIRVVKAFAREDYEQQRFEEQSLENVETALQARAVKAKLSPVVDVLAAVGTCLMLGYGGRLALAGQLDTGVLIVFLLYLGKMYKPIRDLSKMTDTVSKAAISYERIQDVLNTVSRVRDLPRARRAPRFKGKIEFDKVNFSYSPEQQILTDISFAIEPGQVAAFVGPSGAGKSTIVSLIPRFYDPTAGQVKIDGTEIRGYTLHSLREQMSFVLQDTVLFRAPIWQNIAYGKPEAQRAEIIKAAEMANAHEFIEKMPEGYDTMVGERGVSLSGGQRQRIAIARAVIRNTPILLLDEPTSGLDAASEIAVFEALGRLMEGKTCVVIAHHLATVQRADVIFVVQDSQIAERGTHAELLAAGGLYAELHGLQLGNLEERAPEHSAQESLPSNGAAPTTTTSPAPKGSGSNPAGSNP